MRKDTGAIEKDVNDEDGPIGKQSLTEVELIPGFFFLLYCNGNIFNRSWNGGIVRQTHILVESLQLVG